MNTKNLIEDEKIFKDFCKIRGIRKSTIELYRGNLQKYVNFTGKTLEELIDEADEEEELGSRLRKRKITQYLMDFKEYLDTTDLAESTKDYNIKLVRSFYSEYDIQLPKAFRRKKRSDSTKDILYEDLPTIGDISHLLKYLNATYKSITLLCLSSGMSRSEIASLTFKNFYDAISLDPYPESMKELLNRLSELNNLVPLWKITRVKTDKAYFTFSSPEALDAIVAYLKEFNRKFKDYDPKHTDAIFRTKFNEPIKTFGISEMYRKANERAGFENVGKYSYITPHALRRVFASTLERNKMPHLMTRWLMGHTLDKTTSAYFKADPMAIKEEYLQVLDQITTDQVEIKIIKTEYDDIKQRLIEDLDLDSVVMETEKIRKRIPDKKNLESGEWE